MSAFVPNLRQIVYSAEQNMFGKQFHWWHADDIIGIQSLFEFTVSLGEIVEEIVQILNPEQTVLNSVLQPIEDRAPLQSWIGFAVQIGQQ